MILASGLFKIACAPFSHAIRRAVPRAGLLGSLAAIALVLDQLPALARHRGHAHRRLRLPGHHPGHPHRPLGTAPPVPRRAGRRARRQRCLLPALLRQPRPRPRPASRQPASSPSCPCPSQAWWIWLADFWREALGYLPVAIPLALATVVGGIDCTESAAAAGDDYPTNQIIAFEGLATLAGGLFGGVIQSTPYIGHPAYKAMGGRAAYTLATALFVGSAGIFGYFGWIFFLVPKAVIFPILVFVGLEITAQSFHATPVKHFPAVALACVPALAYLALLNLNQLLPVDAAGFLALSPDTQHWVQTITVLAGGGGFILTSLLWSTTLAQLIDGKIRAAALALALAAVASLFGVIHSPLPSSPITTPADAINRLDDLGRTEAARYQTPYHWAAAYAAMSITLLAISAIGRKPSPHAAEEPLAI